MSFQWQLDSFFSLREDGLADHQTEREHGDVQVKVAISGKNLNNILSSNEYLIPCTGVWYLVLWTWYYMNCNSSTCADPSRWFPSEDQSGRRGHPVRSRLVQQVLSSSAINSLTWWILNVFRVDAVFLDHLSQDIRGTNSSAVWRWSK